MSTYVVLDETFNLADISSCEGKTLSVRYDFVGGGSVLGVTVPTSVVFPPNVTLQFDGGSFSGITLTGNDTRILGPLDRLFDTSVIFNGTFVADTFYPEWFGAVGDGVTNDYIALNTAFKLSDHVTLKQNYSIATDQQIIVDRGGSLTLMGYNSIITNNDQNSEGLSSGVHLEKPIFEFRNLNSLTIKGITINGNSRIANALYVRNIDRVTLEDITIFDLLFTENSIRTVALRIDIESPSIVYGNNLHIYDISGGVNNIIGDLDIGIARAIYCVVNHTDTAKTKVTFENSCFEWVYGDDGDIIHIVDKNYISDAKQRFIFNNCTIRYAFRRLVKGSASGIQYYNCRFDTASLEDLKAKMNINKENPLAPTTIPSGGVNFRNEDPENYKTFRNMHGKMINCEYRNSGRLELGSGHTLIAAYTDGLEIRGNKFYDMYVRFQNKTSNFIVDNNQFYNSNISTSLIRDTSDAELNEWETGISYITNNYGNYAPVQAGHFALVDVKDDLISVVISNNKIFSEEANDVNVTFYGLLRQTRGNSTKSLVAKEVYISKNEIIRNNSKRSEYLIVADATWYNTCKLFDNYLSVKGQAYKGANFSNGIFVGFYWNNRTGDGNEMGIF